MDYTKVFPQRTSELLALAKKYGEDFKSIPNAAWLAFPIKPTEEDFNWAKEQIKYHNL